MISEIDLLKAYGKLLISKWYVWTSVAFFIFGFFLRLFTASKDVVIVLVLTISFIGIIASGYKVYRNLFIIIPEELRIAYLPPKTGDPKIDLYYKGGYGYDFGFDELESNKYGLCKINNRNFVLPYMAGQFFFSVENLGYVPVEILSISCNINIEKPLLFLVPKAIESDIKSIDYPLALKHEDKKDITLYVPIDPYPTLTEAEIAVQIREYLSTKKLGTLQVTIKMEDTRKKITEFKKEFSFSPEKLFNLYIDNWQKLEREDLLRLTK